MSRGKIRIWSMAAQSYGFLLRHPGALLRIGWLPLLALFGLNLGFDAYAPWPKHLQIETLLPSMASLAANVLAQSVVAAAVLVAWHRVVLLGEAAGSGPLGIRLGRRELRYLGFWLLLSLLFLAVLALAALAITALGFGAMLGTRTALVVAGSAGSLPLGDKAQFVVLQVISLIGALAIAVYATSRLSLILPALATDRERSFGRAWQLSDGNGWRLVAATLLIMLPIQLGHLAAAQLASGLTDSLLQWPAVLLASAFTLLLITVTGTLLSLFSRTLEQDSRVGAAGRPAPMSPRGAA